MCIRGLKNCSAFSAEVRLWLCSGLTSGNVQSILLPQYSKITPGGLGDHNGCWGLNWDGHPTRWTITLVSMENQNYFGTLTKYHCQRDLMYILPLSWAQIPESFSPKWEKMCQNSLFDIWVTSTCPSCPLAPFWIWWFRGWPGVHEGLQVLCLWTREVWLNFSLFFPDIFDIWCLEIS